VSSLRGSRRVCQTQRAGALNGEALADIEHASLTNTDPLVVYAFT
jgi:hypothetical protein